MKCYGPKSKKDDLEEGTFPVDVTAEKGVHIVGTVYFVNCAYQKRGEGRTHCALSERSLCKFVLKDAELEIRRAFD
jgi:hypothetical protein